MDDRYDTNSAIVPRLADPLPGIGPASCLIRELPSDAARRHRVRDGVVRRQEPTWRQDPTFCVLPRSGEGSPVKEGRR